ncbi:1,2-phenylacetyl-CoA epoxidase subunit PaaD [Noviherbaspirillum sp. ST9]|uniref:1,2-phenylacetyl-CoA epoxidase subunit PaaD n=1 Tax=Noviherbaspirillum sp. ST9 TaxID=3401606 RepID=UPI003B585CE6
MVGKTGFSVQQVWEWLETVPDPEIPVVSVVDLGIVRAVGIAGEACTVLVTPTYSGCPAMQTILDCIHAVLREKGIADVRLETRLSPAWTSDWISAKGRRRLEEYGIAPPVTSARAQVIDISRLHRGNDREAHVPCPRCASSDTREVSRFGSTACKALHVCNRCREPFDYFKCH